MEDYLEMIYRHSRVDGYIRVNRLAQLLNVKDSSATKMIQKLGELQLINYEKYGYVTLTEQGREIGEWLLSRHETVETFLKLIGCENDILAQTELIEHVLNEDTLDKIKKLNSFFKKNEDIMIKYNSFKYTK